MEPGDLLYIPPMWFQYDQALSLSLSANTWIPSDIIRFRLRVFNDASLARALAETDSGTNAAAAASSMGQEEKLERATSLLAQVLAHVLAVERGASGGSVAKILRKATVEALVESRYGGNDWNTLETFQRRHKKRDQVQLLCGRITKSRRVRAGGSGSAIGEDSSEAISALATTTAEEFRALGADVRAPLLEDYVEYVSQWVVGRGGGKFGDATVQTFLEKCLLAAL